MAVCLCLAPAGLAATNADRAATGAYDRAEYRLAKTLARDAPAGLARVQALARQVGRECHGVLAHAPGVEEEGPSSPGERPESALQRGEQARAEAQLSTIQEEIVGSVLDALDSVLAPAEHAFASTVERLVWSDPRITAAVRQQAALADRLASRASPDACADMKAWAGSGFKKLSPASRALRTEEERGAQEVEADDAQPPAEPTISTQELARLLKPYENARDRRLLKRARALYARAEDASNDLESSFTRLNRELGFPQSRSERVQSRPPIATGTTEAGERFEVRLVKRAEVQEHGCHAEVSIRLVRSDKRGQSATTRNECISRDRRGQPSSSCGEGVVAVQLAVPPSVREVRMTLSNGHTITSRVVFIPRRDGGPRGLYIQSVRGYEPHPVSLTELGSGGRVLGVLKLGHGFGCRRSLIPRPEGPYFVKLAQGATPDGRPFTIEDDEVRFRGETEFDLEARPGRHVLSQENEIEVGPGSRARKAFAFSVASECAPTPYAIVYGILAAPGATVQVRTGEGLVTLTKAEIAAKLNSGGPLFYGAFTSLPTELVVLQSNGSTLYSESLASRDTELNEYCAGYAEPAS